MSKRYPEYPAQTSVMRNIRTLRMERQLHANDCARIITEATGYHFTPAMYDACETGVTKNVPLWAVIALLESDELGLQSADHVFTGVGAAWR